LQQLPNYKERAMNQSDLIAFLAKPEAADMDAGQWIAALDIKESAQEAQALATCQAFLDEISALCH
jgi:hypothetical protein